MTEPIQEQKQDTSAPLSLPMAIVVAGFLIAVALIFDNRGNLPSAQPQQTIPPQPSPAAAIARDASKVDTTNDPVIGNPNAPLTMAYWSDYQCPFCKMFEENVLPSLIQTYVDTGKMKIVFKAYAFLGPDSTDAGVIASAIWKLYPNQFLKWNEAMFAAQDEENGGFGDAQSIMTLIKKQFLSMDTAKINQDVAANRQAYIDHMTKDENEGQKNGITGTPGSIIGTQLVSGAQQFDYFSRVINQELQKLGK